MKIKYWFLFFLILALLGLFSSIGSASAQTGYTLPENLKIMIADVILLAEDGYGHVLLRQAVENGGAWLEMRVIVPRGSDIGAINSRVNEYYELLGKSAISAIPVNSMNYKGDMYRWLLFPIPPNQLDVFWEWDKLAEEMGYDGVVLNNQQHYLQQPLAWVPPLPEGLEFDPAVPLPTWEPVPTAPPMPTAVSIATAVPEIAGTSVAAMATPETSSRTTPGWSPLPQFPPFVTWGLLGLIIIFLFAGAVVVLAL